MKRFISFALMLCLLLGVAATALAAGPVITEQPTTQTVAAGGKVSFVVKAKGYSALTWYFINPETGEQTPASKISQQFKGLKVSGQNGKKLTLNKVPETMHGWSLYARLRGNGYMLESDTVQLLIAGKELPSAATPTDIAAPEQAATPAELTSQEPVEAPVEAPVEQPAPVEAPVEAPAEQPAATTPVDEEVGSPEEIANRTITITADNALLFALDYKGNPTGDGASTMTFTNVASFAAQVDGSVQYWSINGVRIQGDSLPSTVIFQNITEDTEIGVKATAAASASAEVNSDTLYTVNCTDCTFTYLPGSLVQVTSGQVPAGATITVIAGASGSAGGYSVNGGAYEHQNQATFRLTIEGDTSIVVKAE